MSPDIAIASGGGGWCSAESPLVETHWYGQRALYMSWSGHQCYLYCNGRGTQNRRHLNSTKLGVTRSRTFVERSTEDDPICSGGTLLKFSLGLHWKMDLRAKPVHKTAGGRFGLQNTTSFAGAVHANCRCYVLIINDYELFFTARESMS